MYIMSVDLGQAQDHTAISIVDVQRVAGPNGRLECHYQVRYLHRPPLGTSYPAIVQQVLTLLDTPPLSRSVPLIVDRTGVGRPVVDMFTAAGVRPRSITITGGESASRDDVFNMRVPKRELASVLVSLFQGQRLKMPPAQRLPLVAALTKELQNFKVKITLSGNDTYEAWREADHDDLVLSVAMACWYAESGPPSDAPVAGGHRPGSSALPHALMQPPTQRSPYDLLTTRR